VTTFREVQGVRRASVHEAGHATIATVLGLRVTSVDLSATRFAIGGANVTSAANRIKVYMAGAAALHHLDPANDEHGDAGDAQNIAVALNDDICLDLRATWLQTCELVEAHWPTIERVAHALGRRGRLTGWQVRLLINR